MGAINCHVDVCTRPCSDRDIQDGITILDCGGCDANELQQRTTQTVNNAIEDEEKRLVVSSRKPLIGEADLRAALTRS